MDPFEKKILDFINEGGLLASGRRLLVACSGGVDSIALLVFAAKVLRSPQFDVAGVHVDHMLRGEESAEDGRFVEEVCGTLGIPFFGGNVPVPAILEEEGGNVQDVCRSGRYAYFLEIMQKEGYDLLATAHHAEDQLETVLMQLARGSIPTGIYATRRMDVGTVIRPFLQATKKELQQYLTVHGVTFREDPSNASDAYLRNRLRHHVAPVILAETPTAAVNASKMTAGLQEDELFLESMAKESFSTIVTFTENGFPTFQTASFADMHTALQKRFIPLLLNYLYDGEHTPVEYNSSLLGQLKHHLSETDGNVTIDLPRGWRLVREYGSVTIVKGVEDVPASPIVLRQGEWVRWGDMLLSWDIAGGEGCQELDCCRYFDLPDSELPLYVRSRKDGDRLLLSGMDKPKRLSRLFIDEKIGVERRRKLPVLTTANDEICAIPGVRYGIRFKERKTERETYIFRMKKI